MPADDGTRRPAAPNRELTAREYHTKYTLIAAGELVNVCDQMAYASQLLSGYRSDHNSDNFMTRFDYLRYQIENHVLRTGMVVDRSLQLVNVIFDLGIPPRDCKYAVVAKNSHVAATDVSKALDNLRNATQPAQSQRNTIAHRKSYADEELYMVEMYSIFQKSSIQESDSELERTANYANREADRFVHRKRSELHSANTAVFGLVEKLFMVLTQPYANRNQRLSNPI